MFGYARKLHSTLCHGVTSQRTFENVVDEENVACIGLMKGRIISFRFNCFNGRSIEFGYVIKLYKKGEHWGLGYTIRNLLA